MQADPIEPDLLRAFQRQIWIQGRFALYAYDLLEKTLPLRLSGPEPDDWTNFDQLPKDEQAAYALELGYANAIPPWFAIQTFLTATANISKALWGPEDQPDKREPLRLSLEVTDSSPLRAKTMRNHYDHFDSRLETWWDKTNGCRAGIDLSFNDPEHLLTRFANQGTGRDDIFRVFNPATGDLVFWGKKIHLPTICNEVRRVTRAALTQSVRGMTVVAKVIPGQRPQLHFYEAG